MFNIKATTPLLGHLAHLATLATLVLCAGCSSPDVTFVQSKAFALNPEEYLQVRMGFRGKVVEVGPGAAFMELEDESGRLFASTERKGDRLTCPVGKQIEVVGSLNRVQKALYFSVEKLVSCKG
jgi:hypothetical protein